MIKGQYRELEIKKFKMIWVSEKSYRILREQKKSQKKSMMRILDNLIKEKYGINKNDAEISYNEKSSKIQMAG